MASTNNIKVGYSGYRYFVCLKILFSCICVRWMSANEFLVNAEVDNSSEEKASFSYNPLEFAHSFQKLREHVSSVDVDACEDNASSEGDDPTPLLRSNEMVVASVQLRTLATGNDSAEAFLERAVQGVKDAVLNHNATLVLLQELFLGPYFCQSQEGAMFALAEDIETSPFVDRMSALAKSLQVVLPISIFEKKNNMYYNSVVMIDSDGSKLGTYRKSHIPDGTGYQEKFYFSPGDTGFKVFQTSVGNVGVGICWDQWFPEAARAMALRGADVLLYPTAIGTEPQDPHLDSADHWQRVMQGHAAANMVPVVAANRVGTEILLDDSGNEKQRITFYGRSFITDETGAIVQEARPGVDVDILSARIDIYANRVTRALWGLFRDRRPDLYGPLATKDGETKPN